MNASTMAMRLALAGALACVSSVACSSETGGGGSTTGDPASGGTGGLGGAGAGATGGVGASGGAGATGGASGGAGGGGEGGSSVTCGPIQEPNGTLLLTETERPPWSLAVDDEYVYWGERLGAPSTTDIRLVRVPLAGGCPEVIANHAGNNVLAVVVDDATIYWQSGVDILATDKQSLNTTILASGQQAPISLVQDGTHVYWANYSGGHIRRVAKGGGAVETLAGGQNQPRVFDLDDTEVYWGNQAGNIAMESSLSKVAKTGGPPLVIATGLTVTTTGQLDAASFYFADFAAPASLLAVPSDGGAMDTVALLHISQLWVDAPYAYATRCAAGNLSRVALSGGTIDVLVDQLACPYFLTTDASHVYFTTIDDNRILKIAK